MEKRPFGKTRRSFPILSFGAQRIVDEEGCNEQQAVQILNTAIDRGIRYFETALVAVSALDHFQWRRALPP
jgi:predicted aldo/keto reductase-like oxidoreductase